MSRKYDRRKIVTALAMKGAEHLASRPDFLIQRCVREKPKYLPTFLWIKLVKRVLKI